MAFSNQKQNLKGLKNPYDLETFVLFGEKAILGQRSGGCPRIAIFSYPENPLKRISVHPEMRIFGQDQGMQKNKHRHIFDIPSIIFFA